MARIPQAFIFQASLNILEQTTLSYLLRRRSAWQGLCLSAFAGTEDALRKDFRMNCRARIQCKRIILWGVTLVMAGGASFLSAGEPIIFGREKSKADPVKETKFGKEISKPWENLPETTPFNGIVPLLPRSMPVDPKKDKRRLAELREKKNWMLYEEGELQDKAEEEAEQFGVREYNFDEEKEDGSIRDLTFKDMGRNRSQSRSPGQSRVSSQQQKQNANQTAHQQRAREDAEAEAKRDSRSKLDLRGTGESVLGTAGQLNLRGLSQAGAVPSAEKGEPSLSMVLNPGSAPELSREQQARREEFKSFLNGPSAANSLSGPSAPVGQRNDLIGSINPVFAKPADATAKTAGDPNTFRGAPANPYANAYNSPVPFLPSPLLRSDQPRSSAASFGTEPPKRSGFGTLGGHRQ